MPLSRSHRNPAFSWLYALLVAIGVSFPLTLFHIGGDPVHLTLLLIPVAIVAWLSSSDPAAKWLSVALLAGLAAFAVAGLTNPASGLVRPLASLALIVGTASFSYLGAALRFRVGVRETIHWLAIASAAFIYVIGLRLLIGRMPVRTYIGPPETAMATFNARVAGMDVFGAFGVLSLAYLIVLQVVVICGAISVRVYPAVHRFLLAGAVAIGCYLIIGSGSRSAQGSLLILVLAVIIRNLFAKRSLSSIFLGLLTGGAAVWLFFELEAGGRILETVSALMRIDLSATTSGTDITTGRLELARQALRDVAVSPVIGTGFANEIPFDGYDSSQVGNNVNSPHLYYLTVFWKGGFVFGAPFLLFILSLLHKAFRRSPDDDSLVFYLRVAVVISFGFMPFFWDILLVPSAGALAYLLLGLLAASRDSDRDILDASRFNERRHHGRRRTPN